MNYGDWEYALWRRHLFMGIGSFTLGAVLLFGYLILTPNGPHRGVLFAVDASGIACWLGLFIPLGISALKTKRRETFFFIWSVTTLVFIAVGAWLDGGIESPISALLVLPVLFGALTYALATVIALAAVADAFFVVVALTGPIASAPRVIMAGVALAMVGVIGVMATINRTAQHRDVQRLTNRLRKMATRDGLTGCLNYQAFEEVLASETARAHRYGRPFSVVMMDLDSFKEINDAHGHATGDATLRGIAKALLTAARTTDMIGRLGGDEFAALLPETNTDQALHVAERLQSHARLADTPVRVSLSMGVATWSGPHEDPDDIIHRADQALYSAKHLGRDQLVVWETESPSDRVVNSSSTSRGADHFPDAHLEIANG